MRKKATRMTQCSETHCGLEFEGRNLANCTRNAIVDELVAIAFAQLLGNFDHHLVPVEWCLSH